MLNKVKSNLHALLEYLENSIDSHHQANSQKLYQRALSWEPVDRLPLIMTYPFDKNLPFQPYPHGEAFASPQKMLYNELVSAFGASITYSSRVCDDLPWTIRANFGTVIIASMFGAHIEQHEDNPPWVLHEKFDPWALERIVEQDPTDLSRGWIPRVTERYIYYREMLAPYPGLSRSVLAVLPDLQSPFDNLELIVGSNLFADICEVPEKVSNALKILAMAQTNLAQRLIHIINDGQTGFAHQHATMIKGNILLRNDSVIMLSPSMYRDIVAPHDECVLREMGGGGIHSCGKIESHAETFMDLPSVRCLDIGQPELNNLDAIYRIAEKKHIPLIRLTCNEHDLISGRIISRFPTGASLCYHAESIRDARRIVNAYLKATENVSKHITDCSF